MMTRSPTDLAARKREPTKEQVARFGFLAASHQWGWPTGRRKSCTDMLDSKHNGLGRQHFVEGDPKAQCQKRSLTKCGYFLRGLFG
jgi:hypothetical protein